MTIRLICGVLLSLGATGVFAQSAFPAKPSLEMRLVPEQVQAGLPQMFTFLLVNTSDHEIHVPGVLNVDCDSPVSGGIFLELTSPGSQGFSRGCGVDVLRKQAILDRVGRWRILRPGDSYSVKAGRERALYNDQLNGRYEFWAHYNPPYISPDDQELLRKAGIYFPHSQLNSAHIEYVKQP